MSTIDFPGARDFPGDGLVVERLVEGEDKARSRALRGKLVQDEMTTDVHQQRLNKPRQDKGRRCLNCGVALYEFESARFDTQAGRYDRVDVCIHCCLYGPPRRPEGSPPSGLTAAGQARGSAPP